MNAQLPIRHAAHQRSAASERWFRARLPPAWTCDSVASDYGLDLRIGVVDGDRVTGLELSVQLKSAAVSSQSRDGQERLRLQVSTYNYLMHQLNLAILVKYVAAEEEAYWVLLRDVPPPNQDNATFTIQIPRENRLSTMDWAAIRALHGEIHDNKLRAGRPR